MRTKKVNRYYCDFCRKGNQSASAMKRHEKGCTGNPNRICTMHEHIVPKAAQSPLSDLISILKAHAEDGDFVTALAELREKADDCPACMFAATRQSGLNKMIDSPSDGDGEYRGKEPLIPFEFKEEIDKFWKRVNNVRAE